MAIEGCCTGYFERLHGDSHLGRDHLCQVTSVPVHTGLYMLFPPFSCFLPWCLLLSKSSVLCQLLCQPPSNDTRRYPALAKEHNVHTCRNAGFLRVPSWEQLVHPCLPSFWGAAVALGGASLLEAARLAPSAPWSCLPCPGQLCPMLTLLRILLQRVFVKDSPWQSRLQVNLLVRFETGRLERTMCYVLSALLLCRSSWQVTTDTPFQRSHTQTEAVLHLMWIKTLSGLGDKGFSYRFAEVDIPFLSAVGTVGDVCAVWRGGSASDECQAYGIRALPSCKLQLKGWHVSCLV